MSTDTPQEQDLRIWWIPQVGMAETFIQPVASIPEAKRVLHILAEYDLFQLAQNIKPDYCNAGGLGVYENGEWVDWESADGLTIDDIELPEE